MALSLGITPKSPPPHKLSCDQTKCAESVSAESGHSGRRIRRMRHGSTFMASAVSLCGVGDKLPSTMSGCQARRWSRIMSTSSLPRFILTRNFLRLVALQMSLHAMNCVEIHVDGVARGISKYLRTSILEGAVNTAMLTLLPPAARLRPRRSIPRRSRATMNSSHHSSSPQKR